MSPVAQPAPNITLGSNVPVATGARTGLQLVTGAFIVEGIVAFELYTFTERQQSWATVAAGIAVSYLQNLMEKRRGQKFIGAAPEPATKPEPVKKAAKRVRKRADG